MFCLYRRSKAAGGSETFLYEYEIKLRVGMILGNMRADDLR